MYITYIRYDIYYIYSIYYTVVEYILYIHYIIYIYKAYQYNFVYPAVRRLWFECCREVPQHSLIFNLRTRDKLFFVFLFQYKTCLYYPAVRMMWFEGCREITPACFNIQSSNHR